MFDKMKQLMEMQKKMQEVKSDLDNTVFDLQSPDNLVKITMNGAQEVKAVTFKDGLENPDLARLSGALKDTFNRAIKRSQELATQKMKEVTGFNIPGLS